jgi:threonine dehydrogenase-like Zn-dependent dehydrogenase
VQNSFQGALDLIQSGVISTRDLLSAPYSLEEFPQALERVRRGEGLKTQIIMHADRVHV